MKPSRVLLLIVLASGCDDGGGDLDAAADAASPDAEIVDATPPAGPTLTLTLRRLDESTALPPVEAIATVRDAAGAPWEGAVTLTATHPMGAFEPSIGEVTGVGEGRSRAEVRAPRSGEVAIHAEAIVDGARIEAHQTAVFLPYLAPGWDIPRGLDSVNSAGPEDSIAISPDGETLFFSYMPLDGCNILPADLGDPPDSPACRDVVYPIGTPERPCTNGVGADGRVTLGLFGDTESWPWPKGMYNTYVAHRRSDGSFAPPHCVTFADDGAIIEVGPSSGPANPVPGEPYDLFFAYPDWLNIDRERGGTVFAVATVVAGENTLLSEPITTPGGEIEGLIARSLTGDIDLVREGAQQIGEYRVHYNPLTANHELYFEARMAGETMDVVVSPLEGTYPVGDWGAAVKVPGAVNSDDAEEGFPWMVELPGEGLHLFFTRGPTEQFTAPMQIWDSPWEAGAWGEPTKVMEVPPTGDAGGVMVLALPSVSVGAFGMELFFVYVLNRAPGLDFQIGVTRRLPPP